LIDTGCSQSAISEEYFRELHIPYTALSPAKDSYLLTANNSRMEQLGNIELTLNCNGLKMPYSFTVLRGLSFKIICGIDFLRDCRVVLNCVKNFIMLYDDLVRVPLCAKVDSLAAVRLQHSINIPP